MASSTETTAFVVALVALTIALFQVIQQYMGTSVIRNKVGRAAIGVWAEKNRHRINLAEWKLSVDYLQPTITWEDVYHCLDAQEDEENSILRPLRGKYHASEAQSLVVRPQGMQFRTDPGLRLRRVPSDPEAGSPDVPLDSLPWIERLIVRKYTRLLARRSAPRRRPVTATWMNLLVALVGNPLDLTQHISESSYLDADSIPSTSDNPTIYVQLSSLIQFGALLDMEIVGDPDLKRPTIHMRGRFCSIVTQEESGLGVVGRYYHSSPLYVHDMQTATPSELGTLVRHAQGNIWVGDSSAPMARWGYNSVNVMFARVTASQSEDWFQMGILPSFREQCENDTHPQWAGKWNHPATNRVPFLLSFCGNPAVANSFPHSLLQEWPNDQRRLASAAAYNVINQGKGFIQAPPGFCASLHKAHIIRNEYKLASNWGAEHGGVRGWAITSGAEFVKLVCPFWQVDGQSEQVPILPEFREIMETGRLDTHWGKTYDSSINRFSGENKEWEPYAGTLCWIQETMLDTWIAPRADLLVQGVTDEAAIPVDSGTANKYAYLAVQGDPTKGRTTGWKRSRALFIRDYLARLADGRTDNHGAQVGVSCMSPGNGGTLGEDGWADMPVGNASDWAALDAVLTLRAVLMATRFELMYNTDVLLDLQQFDPMIRMA
ncbi:hypothetical protein C8R46DRAFT_1142097 [Mycena filopes]|nr:hypothetical protein C8R46DRAFT_1142097 [Mycena filopes]